MSALPVQRRGPVPTGFEVTCIDRAAFVADVRQAVAEGRGYASGKIGTSEKHWMHYPIVTTTVTDRRQRFAVDAAMRYHCRGSGVFPLTPELFDRFPRFYAHHLRQLDSLGVMRDLTTLEDAVLWHYDLSARVVHFIDQEPDRSTPADDERCYLPAFAGKRVLLVAPFAHLLRERATRETFEQVWSRTGKRWFAPASVESIEFPYGFSPDTHARYATVLDLYDEIVAAMQTRTFDVALIAAGALGIPLASAAKAQGRVGLSLGGHLQVLFGVLGQRWRDDPEWRARYITDGWIDMPASYRPAEHATVCDSGCYW